MKKLNVLRLVDQWGWAYMNIAREQSKYSVHNITYKRLQDMKIADLHGIDILYVPGPNMGYANIRDQIITYTRRMYPPCRVICGYAGEHEIMYPDADVIVAISAKFYPCLKEMYKGRKEIVVFMPESVDTQYFTPAENFPKFFTVGWSGRVAEVKRCHLLEKLPYLVRRQSDHGTAFFKDPNRSLQPMLDFYHSITTLVLTSASECMPRVVLEAMACGLPVVATNVGSLKMVMDNTWLVPAFSEEQCLEEMSKKLIYLAKNPEVIEVIGKRNREFIHNYFSWEVNQPLWDTFFWEVYQRHYASVEIYNKQYREKYGELEPALLT